MSTCIKLRALLAYRNELAKKPMLRYVCEVDKETRFDGDGTHVLHYIWRSTRMRLSLTESITYLEANT
jgi:hypothetical protein